MEPDKLVAMVNFRRQEIEAKLANIARLTREIREIESEMFMLIWPHIVENAQEIEEENVEGETH